MNHDNEAKKSDALTQEEKEVKLQEYLNGGDYRLMLNYCSEPKEWKSINRELNIKKGKMFQVLKDLKVINALEFADGKYYASAYAQKYLE